MYHAAVAGKEEMNSLIHGFGSVKEDMEEYWNEKDLINTQDKKVWVLL